jgi:hypothetical protein
VRQGQALLAAVQGLLQDLGLDAGAPGPARWRLLLFECGILYAKRPRYRLRVGLFV